LNRILELDKRDYNKDNRKINISNSNNSNLRDFPSYKNSENDIILYSYRRDNDNKTSKQQNVYQSCLTTRNKEKHEDKF